MEADREEQEKLLAEMKKSIPEHQKMLSHAEGSRGTVETDRTDGRKANGVWDPQAIAGQQPLCQDSDERDRANGSDQAESALLIGLGLFASFGLGIGLVCLLEHVDHSVKVPEHVSQGLTLPLLGVVPRIRRTGSDDRGAISGLATPDSIEADAYRNVRASLLGIADKRGPIVTLLVTSAKAGEGKSTTALNLAATCAQAGERTLLLDVDLRRPSLADVFIDNEPGAEIHGLVDVLRGELPGSARFATPRFPTSTSSQPATRNRSRSKSWAHSSCGSYWCALASLRPGDP